MGNVKNGQKKVNTNKKSGVKTSKIYNMHKNAP